MRIRLFYEKRGGACFVPHVALSTLFSRAFRRAGMELNRTEGFSPRARISFGPELPAGVVALSEPADLWLAEDAAKLPGPEVIPLVNAQLPEGFRVIGYTLPAEGAPALGRECGAARYLVWTRNGFSAAGLLTHFERHYGEHVLNCAVEQFKQAGVLEQTGVTRLSAVLAKPAQNGIGGWVKALAADGAVAGWHDMCIVRTGLGRWNEGRFEPFRTD